MRKNEATVYEFIKANRKVTSTEIREGTGISLVECRSVLMRLKNKGLIISRERTEDKRTKNRIWECM